MGSMRGAGAVRSPRVVRHKLLLVQIRAIHSRSCGTYGVPRVHAALLRQGIRVGCKRVARLMREAGLRGACRPHFICTTHRATRARTAADLVQRHFRAEAPNQLWVEILADMQAEFEMVVEVQYTISKGRLQGLIDSAVSNAPSGSTAPLAAWQEAVKATTTFNESRQTTAKQAAQLAESSFNIAAEAASESMPHRAAKASHVAAK